MSGRLVDYIGAGDVADRPVAGTLDAALTSGAAGFYYAEDESKLYSLNRSGTPAWEEVGGGGGGGSATVSTFLHQSASGVGGGTPTQGAWTTRPLNATQVNGIASASLSSNQVSLPAGTYRGRAFSTFYRCSRAHTRLRNVTDGSTILVANNSYATATDADTNSYMEGTFTLAGTKTLELQYYADSNNGGANGLGINTTGANGEVANFATLTFEKVS